MKDIILKEKRNVGRLFGGLLKSWKDKNKKKKLQTLARTRSKWLKKLNKMIWEKLKKCGLTSRKIFEETGIVDVKDIEHLLKTWKQANNHF